MLFFSPVFFIIKKIYFGEVVEVNEWNSDLDGKYMVVYRVEDEIIGYVDDEVFDNLELALLSKEERVRLTGIDGEDNGYYDVIHFTGNSYYLIG